MTRKAWRWVFAAGIGSGSMAMGTDVDAPEQTGPSSLGAVDLEADRASRRVDKLLGDLVTALHEEAELDEWLSDHLHTGLDPLLAASLAVCLRDAHLDLAPFDVHSVTFIDPNLAILMLRAERDGSWHQLSVGVDPAADRQLCFVRVDPVRFASGHA